jgi:NAD(P)-dependent dehydrogenase (short-subunit alcohol dehydrogenase family)
MKVDLAGKRARISGEANAVTEALAAALTENGAVVDDAGPPDIAVFSLPLLPGSGVDIEPLLAAMQQAAAAMAERGGRIVLVASAIALMPMRRHPEFSRQVAGATAAVRSLAMAHGPGVVVNAVAVGAVGETGAPLVSGDSAMLSYVPLGRPGTMPEVVGAALFLLDPQNSYTTGQVLVVDGGWSVGYGRNF